MKVLNKNAKKEGVQKILSIQLTNEEYRTLIRVLELGENIYGMMGDVIDDRFIPIGNMVDTIESKAVSQFAHFNLQRDIEEFEGVPVLKDEAFSEVIEDIAAYQDMSMWERLEIELAKRDVRQPFSEGVWNKMTMDQRIKLVHEAKGRWSKEFENFGIDRLGIVQTQRTKKKTAKK